MQSLLFRNIGLLLQTDPSGDNTLRRGAAMDVLPAMENAFLLIENGRIADFGAEPDCPYSNVPTLDAAGRCILPCWCDSHTHLVFAASREGEFVDRIKGISYQEIARRGGGILNSARRLRETPEEVLLESAWERLQEVQRMGTGALEIKSGYGLELEAELKMLRVIRQLRERSGMHIKSTFLCAHALPLEYRECREDYMAQVLHTWIPRVAGEGLADYIDVFCEKNFFSPDEMDRILETGARYGLIGKVHTNQFHSMGGIETAIRHGARSVDHLEVLSEAEIRALAQSPVIPTLLPSAPFFLRDHYPPAREMIDTGLGLALASDYNPGSSPSGRIPFVLTLACTQLRMTPNEAINAATINGACAMDVQDELGSIAKGKTANLILTRPIPSAAYLPYAFGSDWIEHIFIHGQAVTPAKKLNLPPK